MFQDKLIKASSEAFQTSGSRMGLPDGRIGRATWQDEGITT
jgi:hypothetical protein